MSDLTHYSLSQAREGLEKGEFTSRELVQAYLDKIARIDPDLEAYLSVDEEQVLRDADAADAARKAGQAGALTGLPIANKDVLNVEGQSCTCASKILRGYISPYDATAVARMRQEGAVFLGRVNMDEFAMGSSTENSSVQVTRNPWNHDCVPGGSSGGSSSSVAGGEALVSIGSDTGGSIRQPASLCGCVGLKPTYGRVSRYGLVAFASSLDQIGPLTRDVRDAAVMLGVLAGHDPKDSTSLEKAVPDYEAALQRDLKGKTIGLPSEYFVKGLDREVEKAVLNAVNICKELGAEVKQVSLPHTKYAIPTYYIIATAEASANLARFDGVRYGTRVPGADPIDMYGKTKAAGFGEEVKRRIILGTYVLSSGYYDAYYLRAQKVRTLIRNDFDEAFKTCDAILTPTTPTPAFKIGENVDDPLKMYLGDIFTATANLAGICGISVPCGLTSDKLPVGLQILGPALGEESILRFAYAFEQATEWHKQHPEIFYR